MNRSRRAEEFKDVKHKRDLFDPSPAPRDE